MVVATAGSCLFFKKFHVFVVVAIQAQQFPVAAIERIVVVIVVLVVHRQLAQARAGKLPTAASADPREQFERPLAVGFLALAAVPARLLDDAVKSGVIGGLLFGHDYWLVPS